MSHLLVNQKFGMTPYFLSVSVWVTSGGVKPGLDSKSNELPVFLF